MKQLLLLFCLINLFETTAQPVLAWEKCYGGATIDRIWSIDTTTDNGLFLAVISNSVDGDFYPNYGAYETWIVRTNAAGDLLWRTPLSGSMDERPAEVITTPDNGCVVMGHSNSNDGLLTGNHGLYDIFIAKLSTTGQVEWLKVYGGSLDETAGTIRQTPDGGYIFVGGTDSSDGDLTAANQMGDVWVVKLNAAGDILWQKTYGGSASESGRAVQLTPEGELVILAGTSSFDGQVTGMHGGIDFWLFKTDANGELLWQRALGGSNLDTPYDLISTLDGGYMAVGSSKSSDGDITANQGDHDICLLKLNIDGELEWQKSYGGSNVDITRAVVQLENGHFLVPGYTVSTDGDITQNYGLFDFWVFETDASGNLIWEKNYGGSAIDWVYEAQLLPGNRILIAGETNSKQQDISFNHGSVDGWIVQLAPIVSTTEQSALEVQITPNPGSGEVYLKLREPNQDHQVVVLDVLGKTVLSQSINGYTPLDISNLPVGAYQVIAESAGGLIYRGKLVKN